LAPVTIAVRPVWSGMSESERMKVVMSNNVVASNNAVNVYFIRYRLPE
jgi:hypothetical protein